MAQHCSIAKIGGNRQSAERKSYADWRSTLMLQYVILVNAYTGIGIKELKSQYRWIAANFTTERM